MMVLRGSRGVHAFEVSLRRLTTSAITAAAAETTPDPTSTTTTSGTSSNCNTADNKIKSISARKKQVLETYV